MSRKAFRAVYFMNYIMQAAFSLITPAGLLIFGGWYLTNRCGIGRWAMIVSIILGVLIGFYSMFQFIFKTMNYVDPTQQKGAESDDKSAK